MKIAIGTFSQITIQSVAKYFKSSAFRVELVNDVSNYRFFGQPSSLDAITIGAQNRAKTTYTNHKNIALAFGLEAGLTKQVTGYFLTCVVSIYNNERFFSGHSNLIKLAKTVSDDSHFEQLISKLDYHSLQDNLNQAIDSAFKNFLDHRPYRIGAIAYIFDQQNHILIDQLNDYADMHWNFPGGGRENNETALQNIYRELKEELNINQIDLTLIGRSDEPLKYDFPVQMLQNQHAAAIQFKGQIKDQFIFKFIGVKQKIKIDPTELQSIKWVTITSLKQYLRFPHQYKTSINTISKYMTN